MAEQQEIFEYSPAPEQTNIMDSQTDSQEVSDPIQIELDANEQYQIGDQVIPCQNLCKFKI